MFYGALKGMVASVDDPYTFFLTPDENKLSKADLEGKFEGIGAQLGLKDNRITVIAPLKKSPAETAGILGGDTIIKVDEVSTQGWTLVQAVAKIRGPKGTKVKLTIDRQGKELNFEIIRQLINVASVEVSFENKVSLSQQSSAPGSQKAESISSSIVAYLKLNQFGTNTKDEWDKGVDEIVKKWQRREIKGMILDLRDNPGGFLESAVYLASEFLPKGEVVVKQESTSQ